jgi:hypothetical protein
VGGTVVVAARVVVVSVADVAGAAAVVVFACAVTAAPATDDDGELEQPATASAVATLTKRHPHVIPQPPHRQFRERS